VLFGEAAVAGGALDAWLARWQGRAGGQDPAARAAAMERANPIVIARNHQVEAALAAAVNDENLAPAQRLLAALSDPFTERESAVPFALPAPAEEAACYRTFCGT
jgi:uncharacterized protein YdiU (UPF0061 family)